MANKRQNKKKPRNRIWRRVILLAVIVLLGVLVITQFKSLSPSLKSLKSANLDYVLLGLLITAATFLVAAEMYMLLTMRKLQFGKTLLIQIASGFTNRLLPAGLGGMSLIAQYLRTEEHTTSEAVAVVGADNIIGIIGHFFLFFLVIFTANVSSTSIHLPQIPKADVIVLLVAIILLGLIKRVRTRIAAALTKVGRDLGTYRKRPGRIILAFCNSLLLTILYVSILAVCAYAVGTHLSFQKVLVVFTAGSIIGNATPTPGGLVGTEAGLFGGFVLYGLSNQDALAAALLYRLLTYWLPIAPGLLAFWFAQRKLRLID